MINAGISEVVYDGQYEFLDTVKKMFKSSGVKYREYNFKKDR